MNYRDRNGTLIEKDTKQDRLLKRLYTTAPGRMLVRILITRPVTLIAGAALRTRVSAAYIKSFINKNSIDMSIYEDRKYRSFNDFFTREIRPGARTVDGRSDVLISPCDAKATAVPIERSTTLNIKGTEYTLESLLRNKALSEEFRGGMCIILRLTVDDYHRYCYACGGTKSENFTIKGIFHTVNPVAAEHAPIYKENSREYTVIDTDSFGRMVHMEVGALMVGKIVNNDKNACRVTKGSEKGRFEFGGSTVILLFKENAVEISPDILANSGDGIETIVKLGEEIGRKRSISE